MLSFSSFFQSGRVLVAPPRFSFPSSQLPTGSENYEHFIELQDAVKTRVRFVCYFLTVYHPWEEYSTSRSFTIASLGE